MGHLRLGQGRHFEFDITRQFIPQVSDGDDIWHLSFTLKFAPTPALAALGAGDRWCDARNDLAAFAAFVSGSPVFRALADSLDGTAELDFERV